MTSGPRQQRNAKDNNYNSRPPHWGDHLGKEEGREAKDNGKSQGKDRIGEGQLGAGEYPEPADRGQGIDAESIPRLRVQKEMEHRCIWLGHSGRLEQELTSSIEDH